MQMYGVLECTAVVYQPRIGGYSDYTYTDLNGLVAQIKQIIDKCKKDIDRFNPGEKQCRYCRASLTCPAVNGKMEALVIDGKLPELTPERLAELYDKWLIIKKVGDKLEKKIKYDLMNGKKVPGYQLKNRVGNREIKDPIEAWDAVKGIITQEEYLASTNVSASKLEKAFIASLQKYYLEKKGEKKTQKELKVEFAELMEGIITRKPDTYTIVKEK
jgi:hypothetical protein